MFSTDVAYPAMFQAVKLGDCKSGVHFTEEPATNELWNLKANMKIGRSE